MEETWKQIPKYEKYEISTLGRIRSFKFKRILKIQSNKRGYQLAYLGENGHQKMCSVSRLILTTFIGPSLEGREASHLNNTPADNRLSNLRWETPIENTLRKMINSGIKWNFTDKEKINIKLLFEKISLMVVDPLNE